MILVFMNGKSVKFVLQSCCLSTQSAVNYLHI